MRAASLPSRQGPLLTSEKGFLGPRAVAALGLPSGDKCKSCEEGGWVQTDEKERRQQYRDISAWQAALPALSNDSPTEDRGHLGLSQLKPASRGWSFHTHFKDKELSHRGSRQGSLTLDNDSSL